MDSAWMNYNMVKIRARMDGSLDPGDVVNATELHNKQIMYNTRPLIVKVSASSNDGRPAGEFTGFLYSGSADVIVTAGHIVGYRGAPPGSGPTAEKFRARYEDGFEEDVVLLNCAPNGVPDIAILRGSRRAPRSLLGTGFSTGDTVYAFGFSPCFHDPSFIKSMVSSSTVGTEAITAYADNGYSGGPVLNCRGQLVGIIKGPISATTMYVCFTPAADLHTFLLQSGQPGLLT